MTHSPIVVQSAIGHGFTVLRVTEKDGAVTAQRLSTRLMKALRGSEVGSLLFEEHLFGVESRFSVEYAEFERRVGELTAQKASRDGTPGGYTELKRGVDKLEEVCEKEGRSRAVVSSIARMVGLQS